VVAREEREWSIRQGEAVVLVPGGGTVPDSSGEEKSAVSAKTKI